MPGEDCATELDEDYDGLAGCADPDCARVAGCESDPKARWKDLPAHVRQVFLYGSGDEEIPFRYDEGGRVYTVTRAFEGVIPNMERRYRETDSSWIREEFERFQNNRPCGTCGGYRLRPEALAVRIAGLHVGQVVEMSIKEAHDWIGGIQRCAFVPETGDRPRHPKGNPRAPRLSQQCGAGLSHHEPGGRQLSWGESQRIRLASQIGSGLTGVLYVLPRACSIGLHQRGGDRLIGTLRACAIRATP